MERIITDTGKQSKGRGRHLSSNMALILLSRLRKSRIMLSASTGVQFLILWFKLDQSISKGRAIKKKVIKSFSITFVNKKECPICI